MDIAGVSGMGPVPFHRKANGPTPLTDEQKNTLSEILAKYDPENFSEEAANSLREELQAADIPKSRETMEYIQESGFDIPKGPPPGGPGMNRPPQINEELKSELLSLLESYQAGDITEDEMISSFQELLQEQFPVAGKLVDGSI